MVAFFLRGAFNASKALALAQPGKVRGEAGTGLAHELFNTAINVSWIVAPYSAAWLYTSRPDPPFLVSVATIAMVMLVSSIAFRNDRG